MSCMGIMMKGFVKGFNKRISQMFVVKEKEIEIQIGGPTDVKHVGHIGFDGPAGSGGKGDPSWMGEFKTGPDFASSSIGRSSATTGKDLSTWKSIAETTEGSKAEGSTTPKKHRRRRHRRKSSSSSSTSSARTGGGSSGASSTRKRRKSRTKFVEGHTKLT